MSSLPLSTEQMLRKAYRDKNTTEGEIATTGGGGGGGASDVTIGDPANTTATQTASKAYEFDGAPFPDPVDEGDAKQPAVTLHGVTPVALLNADGSATPLDDIAQSLRTIEQSPLNEQYSAAAPVISASDIGVNDGEWKNQGGLIDARGTTGKSFWFNFTLHDSLSCELRILSKPTAGDPFNYDQETEDDYVKYFGNADFNRVYEFATNNLKPFLQIQTRALDVIKDGGTTEATVSIQEIGAWGPLKA